MTYSRNRTLNVGTNAGMSKGRKGCIVERAGRLYVRVVYTDQLGLRRELMRRAQNKKHAMELKKQLVKEHP